MFDLGRPAMATHYATVHLASTSSTQDEARARFDGTPLLVVADRQTAGRGRKGRQWQTASRALAASIAVAPRWPQDVWARLTLVAGLAAREMLGPAVALDWPNDLVIGDDKAGGLLAEASEDGVVFGLGVNLWWPQAPAGMAALSPTDPGPNEALNLARQFASGLLHRLETHSDDWGREEYVANCITIGSSVTWEGGAGTAVDVAPDGALIIETPSGIVTLVSSEVERIGRSTVPK